jgi:hypothetical protein
METEICNLLMSVCDFEAHQRFSVFENVYLVFSFITLISYLIHT